MAADDLIRIMCPKLGCQRVLAVPASARGLVVRCRGCRSKVRIPMARASCAANAAAEAASISGASISGTSISGASISGTSSATPSAEPSKRAA